MTHLRERAPGRRVVTYFSVGVRGEQAAAIVADARSYALARGVTFGSLALEALAEYMAQVEMEAQSNASEASDRE